MAGPERLDLDIRGDLGVAVLTIGSFGYYREHEKFFGFVDDAFERIARGGIRNLILDLRQNDGGDPFCAAHLFGYLEREPVPYFSRPYGRYARLSKPIPLAQNNFKGRIFFLIDGGCASTTGHLCGLLKYHSLGTFIGEETGATFFCHDAHTNLNLEHTGFQVGIARRTFSTAVRGLPGDRGIIPDFEVLPVPRDIAAGKDTVLEMALGRCRK
jgi:C-terminal processing protease CtpA/Prc